MFNFDSIRPWRALILAGMAASFALPSATSAQSFEYWLTYAEKRLPDPSGLDPVANVLGAAEDRMVSMILDPLVAFDYQQDDYDFILAESVVQTDSSLVATLRRGVTWHDGSPLRAEDVQFTYAYAMEWLPFEPERQGLTAAFERVEKRDAQTVEFVFPEVDGYRAAPQDPFWFLTYRILPSHRFDTTTFQDAGFSDMPVGTGAFELAPQESPSVLTLARRSGPLQRWRDPVAAELAGDAPGNMLDAVAAREIPSVQTALEDIDIAGPNPARDLGLVINVPAVALPRVREKGNLEVGFLGTRYVYGVWFNTLNGVLGQDSVRMAISMAVDRRGILLNQWAGTDEELGSIVNGPLPDGAQAVNSDLPDIAYNPAEAGAILDRYPDARSQELTFIYPRDTGGDADNPIERTVSVIEAQLEEIGLTVNREPLDPPAFQRRLQLRSFDLAWATLEYDPKFSLRPFFHGEGVETGQNYSGLDDIRINEALDRLESTADVNESRRLKIEAQAFIAERFPMLFMFTIDPIYVYRNEYRLRPYPDAFYFFPPAWQWRVVL